MSTRLKIATEDDLPALHAILVMCGEHMARTQGLTHWYPFLTFTTYAEVAASAQPYAVYEDGFLAGTFYFKTEPRPYYPVEYWTDPDARAFYFAALGVLPSFQGRGIGSWCMAQVERLAVENGCKAIRFDAAANNTALMRFYDRLGYERRGVITFSNPAIGDTVAYERVL